MSQDLASRSNHCDEQLKRLFIVYHKARKDFDSTPTKTLERTKSAKFLRDTTENCLAYIAAKQTRPGGGSESEVTRNGKMLDELRATLEETIAIAEQGSGGKKRRYVYFGVNYSCLVANWGQMSSFGRRKVLRPPEMAFDLGELPCFGNQRIFLPSKLASFLGFLPRINDADSQLCVVLMRTGRTFPKSLLE